MRGTHLAGWNGGVQPRPAIEKTRSWFNATAFAFLANNSMETAANQPLFSSFPSRLADPCNAHPCFFAPHRRTRCYSSNLCFRFPPSSSLFPRVFFFFFVTGFDFVFIASFTVISRWNTWYTQTIHGDKSRGGRIIRARYLRYIGRNTRYLIYYGKTQFIRNGFVAFGYRPLGITRKLRLVAVEKNVSRIAQWGRGGGGEYS